MWNDPFVIGYIKPIFFCVLMQQVKYMYSVVIVAASDC